MATTLADLLIKLGLDATGVSGIEKVSASLDEMDRASEKAFRGFEKLGGSLTTIGAGLTGAITLPLAGIGIAATSMAKDFDQGMRKVTSLIDNVAESDFKNLSAQVLELSKNMGVDAVKATDALYQALSSGVPKENAVDFLAIASKAAIAGMTDTKVAVDGLTTVLQAFNLDASETNKVADAMFAAVKIGKLEFPELASSIGIAAGTAQVLGVSYQELLAAGATLTNTTGQKIPEAMTMLQSAMKALLDPTKEMKELLKSMGYESGVTLLKTKGLEGGLNALRDATGGNIEQFNAAFGRIEGFRAALGLTGTNAEKAAEQLEYMGHASDGLGQAQQALNEINKSTARQWEMTQAQIKATAIELGTALLPAVNTLLQLSQPLISMLASAVQWFTELPAGVQATAIGMTALVAAIGPVVLILGQTITAWAALKAAMIGVEGSIALMSGTHLPAVAGALSTLATGLGLATAAFVLYKQASDLADNTAALTEQLTGSTSAWGSFTEAVKGASKEIGGLAGDVLGGMITSLQSLGKWLKSIDWKDFMGPLGSLNAAVRDATESIKILTGRYPELEKTGKKSLDALGKSNADFSRKTAEAAMASVEHGKQLNKTNAEIDKAKKSTEGHTDAVREAISFGLKSIDINMIEAEEQRLHAEAVREATRAVFASLEPLKTQEQQYQELVAALSKVSPELNKIAAASGITLVSAEELGDAFKRLGITTHAELAKSADQIARDYELIRDSGTATPREILAAWIKMYEAQLQLARDNGDQVTQAEVDRLAKAKESLESYTGEVKRQANEQKSVWSGLGQQVSTIFTDVSRKVADSLFNIFKANPENERLKEQKADLVTSLGERTQEWEQYQRDAAEQLQKLQAAHSESLAAAEADLREKLGKEQENYDEYVSEVSAKLAEIQQNHAEAIAQESDAVRRSLAEKERDYEEYRSSTLQKIEDIRQASADSLADDLEKLRESLADKKEAYDDYAEDVATSLQRITDSLADQLSDQKRSTNRNISDKKKQYSRDVEDLEDKIRKEEAKGSKANREQIDDWKRTLRRKAEDLDEYTRRAEEDLQDFTDEHKLKAEQQAADLKESLERRTRDYQQHIADNAEAARETTAKHAEQLEKQESELLTSLAKRTTDLEEYRAAAEEKLALISSAHAKRQAEEESALSESLSKRTKQHEQFIAETNAKYEADKSTALARFAEQEAALQKGLDAQRSKFDQYVQDTQTKLANIEASFKSIWDRLGSAAGDVLEQMGQGVTRFVLESLQGKLFESLKHLVDDIFPGVGKALNSALGIGSSGIGAIDDAIDRGGEVAGGAASAGGGAASGASGAASGLAGWIGAIGSAVSAISGVIGNFQMAGMNKSLDLIEHETRYSQIHLFNILEKMNFHLPKLDSILGYFYDHQIQAFAEINDSIMEAVRQVRDFVVPAMNDLVLAEANKQPATIVFEFDKREFARAVVDDVTDLQGRTLRIQGNIV